MKGFFDKIKDMLFALKYKRQRLSEQWKEELKWKYLYDARGESTVVLTGQML